MLLGAGILARDVRCGMTVGLGAGGIPGMGQLRPPKAVADDGYAARPEERHPVLLEHPVRAVAPAEGLPGDFWVFLLQPAPHAVPGIGVQIRKGALRDVVAEVVHPPSQDRVDLESTRLIGWTCGGSPCGRPCQGGNARLQQKYSDLCRAGGE